ncbi:MAG: cytidine deaminase [Desulfurococcales archaeon]|nr:cytidine deaminase [Desulfurococcales archaeon]
MTVIPGNLASRLKELLSKSYSPYSRFPVSAIVVDEDGREYTGVNIENSSYGLTVCAERVAIFKAVSEGARKIKRVYVASTPEEPAPPCGACLQVLAEFADGDAEIILYSTTSGKTLKYRLNELMPLRFKFNNIEHYYNKLS